MRRMFGDIGRMASLRKVALACAALVLAITSLSAFLRLSASGLGCEPWPQCYGQSLRDRQQGVVTPPTGVGTAARDRLRDGDRASLPAAVAVMMYVVGRGAARRDSGRERPFRWTAIAMLGGLASTTGNGRLAFLLSKGGSGRRGSLRTDSPQRAGPG